MSDTYITIYVNTYRDFYKMRVIVIEADSGVSDAIAAAALICTAVAFPVNFRENLLPTITFIIKKLIQARLLDDD